MKDLYSCADTSKIVNQDEAFGRDATVRALKKDFLEEYPIQAV